MPMTRGWLKFHAYLTVVCALFTMIIGLTIWFETLKTRKNLASIWVLQPATTQSLLQQKVCIENIIIPPNVLIKSSSTAAATQIAPLHHS